MHEFNPLMVTVLFSAGNEDVYKIFAYLKLDFNKAIVKIVLS